MDLSDRMKLYEEACVSDTFLPGLPVIARLDGRCFHSFAHGLDRPFDKRLSDLMLETTKYLVDESNACIGYTQSDEISLVFYSEDFSSQIYFNGKMFKIISILAATATIKFNKLLPNFLPDKLDQMAVFDCRVWCVPSKMEAANVLVWREQDATRNSISMAAQSCYSHKQLQGKGSDEMQEMLFAKGINWNDYPAHFKRGVYVQRRRVFRRFTFVEREKLPPKHEARNNPDLIVDRTEIRTLEMPPFARVENRVEVVFDGADPKSFFQSKEFLV